MFCKRIVWFTLIVTCFVTACSDNFNGARGNISYDMSIPDGSEFNPVQMTLAEFEHLDYKRQYENKLKEFDKMCSNKQRKFYEDFKKFIITYAKNHASQHLRKHPYHYYGSMIDVLNLGIKHLKLLEADM